MKKETKSYLVNTDDRNYVEKLPFLRREERIRETKTLTFVCLAL